MNRSVSGLTSLVSPHCVQLLSSLQRFTAVKKGPRLSTCFLPNRKEVFQVARRRLKSAAETFRVPSQTRLLISATAATKGIDNYSPLRCEQGCIFFHFSELLKDKEEIQKKKNVRRHFLRGDLRNGAAGRRWSEGAA